MAAPRKTAGRPARRTKAEVEREFADVRAEVEEARQEASPKQDEVARLRETELRQSVAGLTVETAVERVSELNRDIQKALAGLSEQLVEEVARLASVREAVELEKRDLARLHQIDVAATALDQLVEDHASQKREIETEIAEARASWEEETRTAERERKDQEEALKKQRQREIDDYEYKKTLERKKAQDKYDEEMRLLEKKNQEKQETLEKTWRQQEAALREREEELAALRQEVAAFPKRLEQELARASAEAARQTEARFQQETLVLRKDAEADKRLAEFRIDTLEATAAQQAAQIAALQKQLDEAKKQVQDIAVKAIEGASGAKTLAHINQIAMEQAKRRSPES
jgi:colicin import membrane protein